MNVGYVCKMLLKVYSFQWKYLRENL